jgi:gluconolactonase
MTEVTMEIAAEGLKFPEGPIAMDDGSILLVEIARGTLTRVAPDGEISVVCELGGGPNGAAIGPDGHVYICNNGGFAWHEQDGMLFPVGRAADNQGGSIQRVDLATGQFDTVYDSYEGEKLRGPNDLVFDETGGFWFTDHGHADERSRDHGRVFYAAADGSALMQMRGEMISPNGIGLSPDGKKLHVSETFTGRIWSFVVASPGVLADPPNPWQSGEVLARTDGYRPLDSLAVEAGGAVCAATMIDGGISIADQDGTLTHIPVPDVGITNISFGGADMQTAWITGSTSGKLFKSRWPRPGLKLAFQQ